MASTRHDELVEEMRIEHWCLHCDRYWKFTEMEREPDDLPGYCELDAKEDCNERVEQAIARTLKAVVDGELELPVEEGRFDFHMRKWDEFCAWAGKMLEAGTEDFIALSPIVHDPDTGKEEEK